ncbi:MAG: helix-turn-helix transcriptional regulator [Candidatus Gastranaerophilales bacterium]
MQQLDEENLLKLSKKIKSLRMAKSKSLNKFVFDRGYLTTATWSRIENGKFDIKFSTLLRIARMLDLTVSELVSGVNFDYKFLDN